MRVKLEWLNELVDLTGLSTKEIVEKASLYSIEIENVDRVVKASNIVIGHVLTKEKHPDSDHLNLLTVDVKDEVLNIVCGAPNVEAGQYVIIAKVGAKLPGFEIKKSKIRGYESCGMCCSLQELGVETKYIDEKFSKGIYYFEDSVEVGMDASKALNFEDDIIELGITPNRGDLLSMIGVAFEFSAAFNRPLKKLAFDLIRSENKEKSLNIKIETDNCLGYYGQIIKDVKVGESPRWLSSRLIAFGIRSINNLVDITNYVLALYGQPLHAFDLDKIGYNVVIKNAKKGEKFVTLDEIERELLDTDVVITDGNDSMCLGGVMGGLNSEITSDTKNIMLEAAVFDPMTIRKTASRLNLHSEASQRYERGVDLNRTKEALDYACYLYQTLCGASIVGEAVYDGLDRIEDKEIVITKDQVNSLLGTSIKKEEIVSIFEKLNFKVLVNDEDIHVFVPNRRPDISIKEDLIEEVARLYGYTLLPITLPLDRMAGSLSNANKNKRIIQDTLCGLGLNEVVTYSLVNDKFNSQFTLLNKDDIKDISLLMPLTEERKKLRFNLMASNIEVLKYNLARKNKNISNFEISRVYYMHEGLKHEDLHLAIVMSNEYSSNLWQGKKENVDFFLLKGIVSSVFENLGIEERYVTLDKECKELHPNRTALIYVNDMLVGYIGQLHPQYEKDNDLDDTYVCEINLESLIDYKKETVIFKQIQKLPSVERDLALIMNKSVLASDLVECIKKSDKQLLSDVIIFDLYEGEHVKEDEKSIALKLVFTSNDPLTDDVINAKVKRILKDLEYKLNVKLRG